MNARDLFAEVLPLLEGMDGLRGEVEDHMATLPDDTTTTTTKGTDR